MEETLFSFETSGSRREVVSSLRALTDALSGTGPLTLKAGEETVAVRPSEPLELEVELERESDGEEGVELEVEIGWREANAGTPLESDEAGEPAAPLALDELETPDAEDDPAAVRSQATFEVFRDRADEWRWRLVHRNGNVIATSGEGYTTRRNAEKGLRSVVRNAPGAEVADDL